MGYALVYAKRHNLPAHEKMPAKEVAKTFKSSIWALLMPIIILGGIFGGIFTATEAAAVAVVYALIVSLFVYNATPSCERAALLLCGGLRFHRHHHGDGGPVQGLQLCGGHLRPAGHAAGHLLQPHRAAACVILLLLNLLFLIIGMLMEANAAIIMMTPILMPLLTAVRHRRPACSASS
ncbi:MAG: TRAP transporter large permease subunit [Oscillospiraceae bacterium]